MSGTYFTLMKYILMVPPFAAPNYFNNYILEILIFIILAIFVACVFYSINVTTNNVTINSDNNDNNVTINSDNNRNNNSDDGGNNNNDNNRNIGNKERLETVNFTPQYCKSSIIEDKFTAIASIRKRKKRKLFVHKNPLK